MTVDGRLSIGLGSVSDLFVEKGAQVQAGNSRAGYAATGEGSLTVTDQGTIYNNAGDMVIGNAGKGTLTVTNSAHLSSADRIVLAGGATGEGTLNIGTGGLAGIVEAPEIAGGNGNATINFSHINDIDFGAQMTGRLAVNHSNIGTTTLTGESSYAGITSVNIGTWQAGIVNAFSANSDHIIASGAILDLNGLSQNVKSIDNAGIIRFGGAGGTILNLNDTYIGTGGIIEFNTVLGDDNSLTDFMLTDESEGQSFVRVNNLGGKGALTTNGIKIIEITDESFATFNLIGNYVQNGDQAIVAGAYVYKLVEVTSDDEDEGGASWYLQSRLSGEDPIYQGGIPIYEAYPQALLGLNGLNTLQQRVGNRFWAGAGNKVISQGADAIQPYAAPQEVGVHVDGNGVWGRIEGAHDKIKSRLSTSDTDYNQNVFKMQAGIDGLLNESETGSLIGGVFVQYVHGKTKVNSAHGDGEISSDGYGFGGTLTWYGNEGFYIDGQAQVTWYRSDLTSDLTSIGVEEDNHGLGYAFSAETGKRFAIDPEWSVTPQAQLIYSRVDFDSFTDTWDTPVSLDKGDSLQGRLGLTLDHETSWQNANGMMDRSHVYGIANLYYEFLKGTKIDVAGTSFASDKERLWGGVGLGGSFNWNDDKYSIYGEGIINTSLNNFGDSHSLKGNVGFRVKW